MKKNQKNTQFLAKKLVNELKSFNIKIKILKIYVGSKITQYHILPDPGIKIEKIENLNKNISLAMCSNSIRFVRLIKEKQSVLSIEIPNQHQCIISLYKILNSLTWKNNKNVIPIIIGEKASGEFIIYDLINMPHLLIAGSSGSGKTMFIHNIIISLIYKYSPNKLQFLMIDPKQVELKRYNNIPHMLFPIVTNEKNILTSLIFLEKEMNNRYKTLSKYGERNIIDYNKKYTNQSLPYIIVIIDELSDIMSMITAKKIEKQLVKLAQLSRASGIYLILSTQRPTVNVITGLIKANLPTRISFKVTSTIDSRIILDQSGAEQLTGKGDMMFLSSSCNLMRLQSPFLNNNEITKVINFISQK